MHAWVCREYGPPANLLLESRPSRAPNRGEVTVRLHACGLNYPDLMEIAGSYQVKLPLPFVPGREGAGEIVACGEDVGRHRIGERVIAFGLGCYADEVTLPVSDTQTLFDEIDMVTAAAFPVALGTAYHALVQRGGLTKKDVLLVHGATGAVGLAAVQLGKALGATVVATGKNDKKLQVVHEQGADLVINHEREKLADSVRSFTGGRGVDLVLDPVGGDLFDQSLPALAQGGRILVVGFTGGRAATAPTNRLLLKEVAVIGVNIGTWSQRAPVAFRANLTALMSMIATQRLKPFVCRTTPLADGVKALQGLAAREGVGKHVMTCS